MRLFIAEKPSVAKAIASELGVTKKEYGYIECGKDVVTWCFGHMLEQAEPDLYTAADVPITSTGKKIWRIDDLPIIPDKWILEPKKDAEKQIKIINKLVKSATTIINAGDPDREGQLLVDELLNYFKNKKPVLRYWSNAIDAVSVNRALKTMKNNCDFKGFADAAEGRGKADWLIGMNLSRAYTLRARRGGSQVLLTVGRVQTPTLSLVVTRDREIEKFKSTSFHTLHAEIQHKNGLFEMRWQAKEDQVGIDAEGRLIDTKVANDLAQSLHQKTGSITEFSQEIKKQQHPLMFSLSSMTALASKKYGYSAQEVLNTCQSLYEKHKLTTYPRTDCGYLPESQFDDVTEVLAAVKFVNSDLAAVIDNADKNIRSRTWNDKKVSAHHGMIPTMHRGDKSKLNDKEQKIYNLIVRTYLAQFYPLHEFMSTDVVANIAGETFVTKGKTVTLGGWRDVYLNNKDEAKNDDQQALPVMQKGDEITATKCEKRDAKTKPPARFTEGTLITAMVNIHRFITDPKHKKLLREGDGIGTEATRATIISELKRRGYLEVKGKNIISTILGRGVIDALPAAVKSPVLTSLYERMLSGVEKGQAKLSAFLGKQKTFIEEQVAKANSGAVTIAGGKKIAAVSEIHKCMLCGAGLSRRPLPKKKGHYWWGCSNYPTCKKTYPDIKGRPNYAKGRK